jgi:hypothetical protein
VRLHPDADLWFGCPVNKPVVIVGMGQLGATLAEGFLKMGSPVIPVLRHQRVSELGVDPALVVLAVGEDDLRAVLSSVPDELKDRVVLIQNELRPDQWLSQEFYEERDPTIAIVWFEKKAGKLPHVVLPTVLYGPHSSALGQALERLGLPCRQLQTDDELVFELVLKNLYILGLNLGGAEVEGTAGELLSRHGEAFGKISEEILLLEGALMKSVHGRGVRGAALAAIALNSAQLHAGFERAVAADPGHACSGRSAARRLARSLSHARTLHLKLPHLSDLSHRLSAREAQQ